MSDPEYEVVECRTRDARKTIRKGEALPTWSFEEWVNALAVKLGQAALIAGQTDEAMSWQERQSHRVLFLAQMEALAAVAQDAWVAVQEGRLPS